ncbi:myogenesis-regulating glycosidase-like [Plodia interpunctella]|uniref:myogenesis-regulating glycosidase-like n=1 Tax=Plodia interpunctella TaxID=58824 RepID=UPI002367A929|nr:myogenesis-regulating glycosidase-like [Plodia interpunctella]
MAPLVYLLAFLSLSARALGVPARQEEHHVRVGDVTLSLEPKLTGGFQLTLIDGDESTELGFIGRTLVSTFTTEDVDDGVLVTMGAATLLLNTVYNEAENARGIKIKWDAPSQMRLEDCLSFGAKHWYAGPMQIDQVYPIQYASQVYSPLITKEDDNGAIMERYWLNSAGEYIFVHPQVPLFVDYSNILANHICLGAQVAEPYSPQRNHTELSYDFWILPDVKKAHKHAVENYLGKPTGVPDYRMIQHPIWSTWAQYSRDINETNLLEFAHEILHRGFNNSQFEIDDQWETCYGSLNVDVGKFPNFANLVQELKSLSYRVTLWIHPFINRNCEPWYSNALDSGYLVLDESGSPDTSWWNNNGSVASYIDFTNPAAAEWWYERVKNLTDLYGIDSFKFDAGESYYAPQISVQRGDIDRQPHHITQSYVRTCARFGDMIEVRTGFRTQDLPVFVRMVDRDSIWGLNNGLATIITTTLEMNLNGYTLVLPDMIGGNGFNLDHDQSDLPTKELFIRWVQANTFLPAMQYSFVPWNFDNETVEISKKYTELHAQYADHIYEAMQASVENGSPVNAPLWWIAPLDPEALVIWDEYLLGESILVAPVLQEGVRSRDIYLPAGTWFEGGDPEKVHEGPIWIRGHPAPLDVLPFFVRESASEPDSANLFSAATVLVLLGLIANIINN